MSLSLCHDSWLHGYRCGIFDFLKVIMRGLSDLAFALQIRIAIPCRKCEDSMIRVDWCIGAPLRNGLKLLGVGFSASLFGVGCTNAIIFVRQQLDSGFHPQNPPQDVLIMSAAYASYMAISSNLRYQVSCLFLVSTNHSGEQQPGCDRREQAVTKQSTFDSVLIPSHCRLAISTDFERTDHAFGLHFLWGSLQ